MLRLLDDVIPLIDAPTADAVAFLSRTLGDPKVEAADRSDPAAPTVYEWPSAGLALAATTSAAPNTITVYAEPQDGFDAFRGKLSDTVSLPADRRTVRVALGDPTAHQTAGRRSLNRLFGAPKPAPEWDRYDRPESVIRFQYDATRRLSRITLMSPAAAPLARSRS